MADENLMKTADMLAQKVSKANASTRIALQPELSRVLEKMTADGQHVPSRLRRLDAALVDEAIEARFDNMPI